MGEYTNYLERYAETLAEALKNTAATDINGSGGAVGAALERWADIAKARRDGGGVFFFAGNGASATMAEHLSHDCFQNADMLTYTCSETAHITAVSNDISYERVFAYRISKMCRAQDVLTAISSSGNSPNILSAIAAAREKGMFVVTLSGLSSDNSCRKRGDLNFYVPLPTYGLVESAHSALLHCWLDLFLDKYMGGRH
jgi:D-sedoheptulose 7-phosphate isomerase